MARDRGGPEKGAGTRGMGARLGGLLRLPLAVPERPCHVTVLLTPERVPPGCTAEQAVSALRRALLARPGVLHVDVQPRPFLSREEQWLTVAAPGEECAMPAGRAWAALLSRVEATALQALAEVGRSSASPPSASAAISAPSAPATGFAEASPGLLAPGPARRPRGRPRRVVAPDATTPPDEATPAALALLEQLASQALSPAPAPADATPAPPPARRGWSDHALLTKLLSLAGRREDDHAGLATELLARHAAFAAVLALPPRELLAEPGVNAHTAANIKLVHAAALRFARAEISQAPVLDDQAALLAYLTAVLARERIEQFRILFLDAGHRLISDEAQARGTVNHTPVYPREVAKRALELHAASLILVHNHPSGDPSPSQEDVGMTGQVRRALQVVDVALQDHLIVGSGQHFSFRQAGLLEGG